MYIYTCIFYYSKLKQGIYTFAREKKNAFSFSVAFLTCRLHVITHSCWLVLPGNTLLSRAQGATVLKLQERPCDIYRTGEVPQLLSDGWMPKFALINLEETFKARPRKSCEGNSFSQTSPYQLKQAQGADILLLLAVVLRDALERREWCFTGTAFHAEGNLDPIKYSKFPLF